MGIIILIECEKTDIEKPNDALYECSHCHCEKNKFHVIVGDIIFLKCCECGTGIPIYDVP